MLSPVHTVAENGDCRRFLRHIVAEIGDYCRQCGQDISHVLRLVQTRISTGF